VRSKGKVLPIRLILSGVVITSLTGIPGYTFGVFVKPLEYAFLWSRSQIMLVFSIGIISSTLLLLPIGHLADKKGARFMVSIGAILMSSGFFFASISNDLIFLSIFYGVMAFNGASFIYISIISAYTKLFFEKKGLILGLLLSTITIVPAVLAPFATYIIINYGWRLAFQLFSLIPLLSLATFSLTFKERVKRIKGKEPIRSSFTKAFRYLVKDIRFHSIWITFTVIVSSGIVISANIVSYAVEIGIKEIIASFILSLFAIFSTISRLMSGWASDYFSRYKVLLFFLFVQAINLILILPILSTHTFLAFLASSLAGLCYGSAFVLMPAITSEVFNSKEFATIYSMVLLLSSACSFIFLYTSGLIYDTFKTYTPIFLAIGLLTIIDLFLTLKLKKIGEGN
jgi:MFS family permease